MDIQLTKQLIKLHIGAFDQSVDGWLNTDVTPHLWIGRIPFLPFLLYQLRLIDEERYRQHGKGVFRTLKYMNLTKQLKLNDCSCCAIFSSHVLEHLFIDEIRPLLKEMYRILVAGGVCRIVVPDLEQIMKLYSNDNPEPFLVSMFEIGKRSAIKNAHHTAFTARYLVRLLKEAGFTDAYQTTYRFGRCPDIELLDNRPNGSIFVEGIK